MKARRAFLGRLERTIFDAEEDVAGRSMRTMGNHMGSLVRELGFTNALVDDCALLPGGDFGLGQQSYRTLLLPEGTAVVADCAENSCRQQRASTAHGDTRCSSDKKGH